MKKKLAALDQRVKIGGAVLVAVIFGVLGNMLVVSPKHAEAAKLRKETTAQQSQTYQREAELKASLHPPAIETADLFRLQRAMPDDEDMPGIILTLSQIAQQAGITFDSISPVAAATSVTTASYQAERIELVFNGDFYSLSDFLYRLRSMVMVHDGALDADGRLFNVDTVNFQANTFPQIAATIYVDAYVYGAAPPPATSTAPAAPTTTDSSDSLSG